MKLDEILKTDYYWQELSDEFLNVLDSVVRPLMKRHQTTFVQDRAMLFEITVIQLEVLELERLILQQRQISTDSQDRKIELVKNKIRKLVFHLRENINKVKEKIETINKVKSQDFGTPFNYDELETVKDELAPIMQYSQRSIINDDIIEIDISDDIEINEELQINLFSSFGEGFKYNIEQFLNRIASENIVLQKIKRGQKTTEQDIQSLVSIVLEQNPHFTLKQLEKLYPDKAQDIDLLIRSIIGVDEDEVHSRIQKFISNHTTLTSVQLQCLKLIENQLKTNRYFNFGCLYEQPFVRLGFDIFSQIELDELKEVLDGYIVKEIAG